MQRAHLIVHGLVQGVFFRYNAKKEALNLGLKGYTKNLPDGTVEFVAEETFQFKSYWPASNKLKATGTVTVN